jgi:hypothetical protein
MLAATRVLSAKRPTAAAFDPRTQVTALHALWADDPDWSTGKPADGGSVSQWRNQSGAGDPTASGTAQPTWRASVAAFNNHAAVEFDGSTDFLSADVSNTGHPWKAIIVGKFTTATNNKRWVGWGNSSTDGFGVNSTGAGQWVINNGSGAAASVTKDTVLHVFRMTVGSIAEGCELWQDGLSIMSGANSGAGNFNLLRVGATGTTTGALFAAIQVGFYAVYDDLISDTDLAQLCLDLETYYGL